MSMAFWLALMLGSVLAAAEPATDARSTEGPSIGCIGVWERAMPTLTAAAQAQGCIARLLPRGVPSVEELRRHALILVLNVDAADAGNLAQRLVEARAGSVRPLVLSLDRRDSQTALAKAGVLTSDPRIPPYWKASGPVNLRRLFAYLRTTYLGSGEAIEPPVLVPEQGYYLPGRDEPLTDIAALRSAAAWNVDAPVAALLIQQSFWITQDTAVIDAQAEALRQQGFNVAICFAETSAQMESLIEAAKPDILIEDRHGGLWSDGRGDVLRRWNVPYLRPISMLGATIQDWQADPQGLNIRDRGMFLSLQELYGTIEPLVVGGLVINTAGFRLHEPIPERVERMAARAKAWVALRRTSAADQRVAIVYWNKYLGKGDLMRGSPTGAFLDGPESLVQFLPAMQRRGYRIDTLPKDATELIGWLMQRGRLVAPWAQGELEAIANQPDSVLIPMARYRSWYETRLDPAQRRAVEDRFGPPPGRFMVVKRNGVEHLVIPRIRLGNVILLPQPLKGEVQDEALLHNRDVPPPHNFLATHWWLQEEFKPHALVMWGTHGSLELLPGKDSGLSQRDWPDLCLGTIPVIYPWIMDNLGEASLARRRAYACLISHLPPLGQRSGLGDELQRLAEDIDKFEQLEAGVVREEFRARISAAARSGRLPPAPSGDAWFTDAQIEDCHLWLHAQTDEATPTYLHVLGRAPSDDRLRDPTVTMLRKAFLERLAETVTVPAAIINEASHRDTWLREQARLLIARTVYGRDEAPPSLREDIARARSWRDRVRDCGGEINGILDALAGGFIPPGPGPDPVRNPASVPSGRNLYGLNPEEIPTQASYAVAVRLVDALLATTKPTKVGIDLNGMETMRDFGVNEGQVLALLGCRPIWDHNGLAVDVELIPGAELKRPRVDVFVALGGMYKENFPTRVKLLAKAVGLAAAASESDNGVAAGSAALRKALSSRGMPASEIEQLADARIFGTKPGNMSGTNILHLIPRSGVWDDPAAIASVYIDSMSHVYTNERWGERVEGLYEGAIQGTDTLVRVWASNMTSQLSNHHAYEYLGGLSMAVRTLTGKEPIAFIADVRNPDAARLRHFEEVLESNLRSELLNKNWLAGMQAHDYAGAGHIAELTKNTFGWSVTRPGSVDPRVWDDLHQVLIKDRYGLDLPAWFERTNAAALQEVAATLLEASRKGYWQPDSAVLREIAELYTQLVTTHGAPTGIVGGGNRKLEDLVAGLAPGQAAAFAAAMEESRSVPPGETVLGTRLEATAPSEPADATPTPESAPPANAQRPTEAPPAIEQPTDWLRWLLGSSVAVVLLIGLLRRSGAAR